LCRCDRTHAALIARADECAKLLISCEKGFEDAGDDDHLAQALNDHASLTIRDESRAADALLLARRATKLLQRVHKHRDHQDVAGNVSVCADIVRVLGQNDEALILCKRAACSRSVVSVCSPADKEALAMRQRLLTGDHVVIAQSIAAVAYVTMTRFFSLMCLQRTSVFRMRVEVKKQYSDALPLFLQAGAMLKRLEQNERYALNLVSYC
jgi:hypothetical protein